MSDSDNDPEEIYNPPESHEDLPRQEVSEWGWEFPLSRETSSDDDWGDGVAVWDSIPVGTYSITIEHPDFETATYYPDFARDDEDAGLILDTSGRQPIIRLVPDQRPRYETIIRARDQSGSSVTGVAVTIDRETITTSGTGRATFNLPEGTYTITLSRDGYVTTEDSITVSEGTDGDTFDFTIEEIETGNVVYPPEAPPLRAFALEQWPLDGDTAPTIGGFSLSQNGGSWTQIGDGIDSRSGAFDAGSASQAHTLIAEDLREELHFDPFSTWTVSVWAYVRGQSNIQLPISLEASGSDYVGLGVTTGGRLKIYSNGRTPGEGDPVSRNEWHCFALSWDGERLHAVLDGEIDYSYTVSDAHEWMLDLEDLVLGTRRRSSSGELDGLLDQPILFDAALSPAQHDAIASVRDGPLPGSRIPSGSWSGVSVTLDASADIPAGGGITLTVHEETDTGTNTETVQLSDGLRRYPLDSFSGEDSPTYTIETEIETSNPQQTPRLRERALNVPSGSLLGSIAFADPITGDPLQIPVHHKDTLDNEALQARRNSGEDYGALRLVDPEGVPLQCRHPLTDEVYGIEFFPIDTAVFD